MLVLSLCFISFVKTIFFLPSNSIKKAHKESVMKETTKKKKKSRVGY